LLQSLQQTSNSQCPPVSPHAQQLLPAAEPSRSRLTVAEPGPPAPELSCLPLLLNLELNLLDDTVRVVVVITPPSRRLDAVHPHDDPLGFLCPTHMHQPPRRLGHVSNHDGLNHGWGRAQSNHPAPPDPRLGMLGKRPADNVGDNLAQRDSKHIERDDAAAVRRRCHLGEVQRRHETCRTHGCANDTSSAHHCRHRAAGGLREGAGGKKHVGDENHTTAPEPICQDGRERRKDQRK